MNVAQVGVGYWGVNLLRNLAQNKNCSLTTVVELSDERQDFVRLNYPDVNITKNLDDVLHNTDIDAVVIATPAKTHYKIAIKVLENGKHVLVEKPMATNVEEVRKIGDLAKEQSLVAMVGHTFLFNSAVRYVKELIDSKELGEIRYIYSQRLNLGRIRDDVDAMWNLAPHDVSIIQYWLGNPTPLNVQKKGMDYVQKGIHDVVFLNIDYPNKVLANIHVSWLDPHKTRRMTIVGSKKMIVYDDMSRDKIKIFDKGIDRMAVLGQNMDFDNPQTFDFNLRSGEILTPNINWVEPLKEEIQHFINCIKLGESCITDSKHAEIVVQILEDA